MLHVSTNNSDFFVLHITHSKNVGVKNLVIFISDISFSYV